MGEATRKDFEQLKDLQKELEESGYIKQNGEKLELTPKGIRKIGEKALRDIFSKLRNASIGSHETHKIGLMGEHSEENTKNYEFGDQFMKLLSFNTFNHLTGAGSFPIIIIIII